MFKLLSQFVFAFFSFCPPPSRCALEFAYFSEVNSAESFPAKCMQMVGVKTKRNCIM